MRFDLYENETQETVSDAGGTGDTTEVSGEAAPVSPEATPGAGAVSPEAEATSPQAPEIDWDSPEVHERLAEMSQRQVEEYLGQLAEQANQPEQVDLNQLDPLDPGYTQTLLAAFQQMLESHINPLSQTVGDFQADRVQSQVTNLVAETAEHYKDTGIQPSDIELLGNAFAPQVRGEGEQAVRSALKQGADWLASRDKTVSEKAVADYKASLAGDGDQATPYEPGVRGAGLGAERPARDELDFVRRMNARTPV